MIAETLSVGTELLLGQIVDTDAAYLAKVLSGLGVSIYYRTTVGDNLERIREAVRLALNRCDLLITCGGLGPTMDDITKEAVCEVLDVVLVEDADEVAKLQALVAKRGWNAPPSFYKQALVPEAMYGRGLPNSNGTAPGILVEKDGKMVICLPGPPNELEPMVDKSVIPYLVQTFEGKRTIIQSRVLRIIGIGESHIEELTRDLLLSDNPTVAPLAKLGECHLRITARTDDEDAARLLIEERERAIRERLGDAIFGIDDQTLEVALVQLLAARNLTIATAESCTGGLLAERITNVPGASKVFGTGIVAYANSAKSKNLGVPTEMLERCGAVSPETAAAMAEGALRLAGASVGVGITGIAGPEGGTPEKPVGLVYIGIASVGHPTQVDRHDFSGQRDEIRARAAQSALASVRSILLRS